MVSKLLPSLLSSGEGGELVKLEDGEVTSKS